MNSKIKSVIKYVLLLAVGTALLWLAFRKVDIGKTIDEIKHANLFWLSLSILTGLIAFTSRAIRWNLLIEPLGYKPKLDNTLAALMIGYLVNLAVPRLGEISRCGTLSQTDNIPVEKLIGTVIFERIIDVISLLICMLLVAISEYDRLGNFLNQNIFDPLGSKFNSIIHSPILIAVVLLFFFALFLFLFKSKKSKGMLAKATEIFKGIAAGLVSVRSLKKPFQFIFHSVLIWFMYFLMSYLCFSALPATSQLSWHAGLFILVVGGMGMSAPVQGGIGAYHLLVSSGLLLYGIAYEHGIAFATLMHTSQTVVVLVFGGLAFLYLFLKKRNGKTIAP